VQRTAATRNPFDVKYSKVEDADWETCATVLNRVSMRELLSHGLAVFDSDRRSAQQPQSTITRF